MPTAPAAPMSTASDDHLTNLKHGSIGMAISPAPRMLPAGSQHTARYSTCCVSGTTPYLHATSQHLQDGRCSVCLLPQDSTTHPVSCHRRTVTQFQVDAEHSTKKLLSKGIPAAAAPHQDNSRQDEMICGCLMGNTFTSPGSLSDIKYKT